VVSGGGTTTTFNPSNKSTHITLSGGNLIATSGSGSGNATAVTSIASHSTGQYYAEFTLTNSASGGGNDGVGLCNSSFVPDGGSFLGNNANSLAVYGDSSAFNCSGVIIPTYTTGDIISMAVDLGAGLVWFRKNAGDWNTHPTGDPATGVGGGVIGTPPITGAIFAAVEGEANGDVWTANFGGSSYVHSVPSGYSNW
jgi:hypothetical protein